ncbi:MAG: DNA-binding CsgD family transcriptional regulator [Glaciecola sp.]|jgi:DNA-binding CsgD family transcriptional regulator|uniref:helix-turn-helix transcriptional regulator n=2 Tax=Congregibacter sp. TaxID=2744308 RepID=UPI0039E5E34B
MHLVQEWVLLELSACGCVYLIVDIRRRTSGTQHLNHNLTPSDAKLASLSAELRDARHAYSSTVQEQCLAWALTSSEQQVALLLLKGLSLQEIAAVLETREKTVRQQTSNIYGKAGLEGRHALAAWFLQDFVTESAASYALTTTKPRLSQAQRATLSPASPPLGAAQISLAGQCYTDILMCIKQPQENHRKRFLATVWSKIGVPKHGIVVT